MIRKPQEISIHSFLVESDLTASMQAYKIWYFNPQLPRRKRQRLHTDCVPLCNISIHSFLVESDVYGRNAGCKLCDFNPQLPRRKRQMGWKDPYFDILISIHSFLVESDSKHAQPFLARLHKSQQYSQNNNIIRFHCCQPYKNIQFYWCESANILCTLPTRTKYLFVSNISETSTCTVPKHHAYIPGIHHTPKSIEKYLLQFLLHSIA